MRMTLVTIASMFLGSCLLILIPVVLDVEVLLTRRSGAPLVCFARGQVRVSLKDCGHADPQWHYCMFWRGGSRYKYSTRSWLPVLSDSTPHKIVVFPPQALAILSTLTLSLTYLAGRWLMQRRRRALQCEFCGYPRHGLNTDRCPECGMAARPDKRPEFIAI